MEEAGCQIVRVTVNNKEAADAIKEIKKQIQFHLLQISILIIAWLLLLLRMVLIKLRINPGNIGKRDKVEAVVKACKERGIPIRIGVNAGSLREPFVGKVWLSYS